MTKRRKDKGLARCVYWKHGAYWHVQQNKWTRLGKDYPAALRTLATMDVADGPPVTVETLIAQYEIKELPKLALRTQQNRLQQLKAVRDCFGKMHPNDIETSDVFNFWQDRGEIPQAKKEVRALSALLSYGRLVGCVKKPNVCFDMDLPEYGKTPKADPDYVDGGYVTDADFLFARERAPRMMQYAMDLALIAGMDGATIRRLERRHITDDGLKFERGKTGEHQLIEWNDDLRAVIDALKREQPQLRRFLLCSVKGRGKGGPLTLDGFQTAWQRVMAKVKADGGKRFGFHDLRGKSGSDAADDAEAQQRLGHKSVETTRKHYRRLPVRGKALARPIS